MWSGRETPRRIDQRVLAAVAANARGVGAHGWLIADSCRGRTGLPLGHGTLYASLARLIRLGLLIRETEGAAIARAQGRPPRRLYRLSPAGAQVVSSRRPTAIRSALPARTAS